ncbi:MAG: hypothetical protein ACP5G1_04020 [Nanopusillaceae archaeon]
MDFIENMIDVISDVVNDEELKVRYGGWIDVITPDDFRSNVHFYKIYKDRSRTLNIEEYYSLIKKIYDNLEYIGLKLNIVFNLFAYDKLQPNIALGIGDSIIHDRDTIYVGNVLYNVGFSGDIAIIDTIRNIGYVVIINRPIL